MSKEHAHKISRPSSGETMQSSDAIQERVLQHVHRIPDRSLIRLIEEGEFFAVIAQHVRRELIRSGETILSEEGITEKADFICRAVAVRVRKLLRDERAVKASGRRL